MKSNVMASTSVLIPTFQGTLNRREQLLVNARDLHSFLEVGRDFTTWIKGRIHQYDFVENHDFLVFTSLGENLQGGRPSVEYSLSLNTAKELAMVENNDQGRRVRRYFIQMEEQGLQMLEDRLHQLEKVKIHLAEASPEVKKLIRYRDKGLTIDEIATLMGYSRRKVCYQLRELQALTLINPKRRTPTHVQQASLALFVDQLRG